MEKLKKNIDKQLEFNKGKNLFHPDAGNILKFIRETVAESRNIDEIDDDQEKILIGYATDKALQEFCRINQYFSFNEQDKAELREIYATLFSNIRKKATPAEVLSANHYRNLKAWLQKTNPFAEKLYAGSEKTLEPVPCSEYSVEMQLEILRLDITLIEEPVLDIGCGKEGALVQYLRGLGVEACGFDRFASDIPPIWTADWLEFDYGQEKWGTIISNLGFSNHFHHHHLREDGDFIGYARKYMDILHSLKPGGSFHYAPELPFIEQFLEDSQWELSKHDVGKYGFKTAVVKRMVG